MTWPSELITVSTADEVGFSDGTAEGIEEMGPPGYSERIGLEELGGDPPVLDSVLLLIPEAGSTG